MTKRVDSQGALALRGCGKTQAEIARLCGVSRTIVSDWWHGRKVPGPEHKARLEVLGLVLAGQWDRSSSARKSKTPKAPSRIEASAAEVPLDTRAELVRQAERQRLRLAAGDLSPAAENQIEGVLGRALASIAKLDGAHITEQTVMRSPAFRQVMAALATVRVEALQKGWTAAELVRAEADLLAQMAGQ